MNFPTPEKKYPSVKKSGSSWEVISPKILFYNTSEFLKRENDFIRILEIIQKDNLDKESLEEIERFYKETLNFLINNSILVFGTSDIFPNFEEVSELNSIGVFLKSYNNKFVGSITKSILNINNQEIKEKIFDYTLSKVRELIIKSLDDILVKFPENESLKDIKESIIRLREYKREEINSLIDRFNSLLPRLPYKFHSIILNKYFISFIDLLSVANQGNKFNVLSNFLKNLSSPHIVYFIHRPVHPYDYFTREQRLDEVEQAFDLLTNKILNGKEGGEDKNKESDFHERKIRSRKIINSVIQKIPYHFPFISTQLFNLFESPFYFEDKAREIFSNIERRLITIENVLRSRNITDNDEKKLTEIKQVVKNTYDQLIKIQQDYKMLISNLAPSVDELINFISYSYYEEKDSQSLTINETVDTINKFFNERFGSLIKTVRNLEEIDKITRNPEKIDMKVVFAILEKFNEAFSAEVKKFSTDFQSTVEKLEVLRQKTKSLDVQELKRLRKKINPLSFLSYRSSLYSSPLHLNSVKEMLSYEDILSLKFSKFIEELIEKFKPELLSDTKRGRIIGYFEIFSYLDVIRKKSFTEKNEFTKIMSSLNILRDKSIIERSKFIKQIPVRVISSRPSSFEKDTVYFWLDNNNLQYHIEAAEDIKPLIEKTIRKDYDLRRLYEKGFFRLTGISLYYTLGRYSGNINKKVHPSMVAVVSEEMGNAWKFFEIGLQSTGNLEKVRVFPAPFIRITFPENSNLKDYPLNLHFIRNLIRSIEVISLDYLISGSRKEYHDLRKLSQSLKEIFNVYIPLLAKVFLMKVHKNMIKIATSFQEKKTISPDDQFREAFEMIFRRETPGISRDIEKLIHLNEDEMMDLSEELTTYGELKKLINNNVFDIERKGLSLKILVNWSKIEQELGKKN